MLSDAELARRVFPKAADVVADGTNNAPLVTTARGHAIADSASGSVTVVLDADALGVDASIDVPTGARIAEGDEVLVTISGTTPVDAVAAGWGETLMKDVQLSIKQNTDSISLVVTNLQDSVSDQLEDINSDITSLSSTVDGNMTTIESYMTFGQGTDGGGNVYPLLILGGGTNDQFSVRISNEMVGFMEENELVAYINNRQLYIKNANVTDGLTISNWMWIPRANGNLALKWVG